MIWFLWWLDFVLPLVAMFVLVAPKVPRLRRVRVCFRLAVLGFFGGLCEVGAFSNAGPTYSGDLDNAIGYVVGAASALGFLRLVERALIREEGRRKDPDVRGPGPDW